MTPIGIPMRIAIVSATVIRSSVCGIRVLISSTIDRCDVIE
jgi:hypothetical protein